MKRPVFVFVDQCLAQVFFLCSCSHGAITARGKKQGRNKRKEAVRRSRDGRGLLVTFSASRMLCRLAVCAVICGIVSSALMLPHVAFVTLLR